MKKLILMLTLHSFSWIVAQNPGGVPTAPTLWYRADVASTLSLSGFNESQWKNYKNPTAVNQTLFATTYNAYGTGLLNPGNFSTNFFPIVNFVSNNGMHTPVGNDPLALVAGTNYAMFLGSRMENQQTTSGNAMVYFTNPTNNDIRPGLGNVVSNGVTGAEHRQFGTCGLTDNNFSKNLSPFHTTVISGAKNSTLTYTSNSGSEQSTAQNYNCVIERQLRMGRATNTNNNNWGGVQEFIMFTGTTLTATQRRQVESYLAIRQGVTLLGSYYSETGSLVWNNTPGYQNRVFGLAKQSAIDVKVSNSVEQLPTDNANRLTVATTKDFTSLQNNASRTSFTNNGSYVIFGDNAGSGQTNGAIDPCTGLSIPDLVSNNRVWRVQTSGSPDAIFLQINLSHTSIVGDAKMIISDNATFTSNVQQIQAIGFASKIAVFNHKFSAGVKYIKFMGSSLSTDCLGCEYTGSRLLEFTSTNWIAGNTSNTYNLGGLSVQVINTIAAPAQWYTNKFPRAAALKSLQLKRKGDGGAIMQTRLVMDVPSRATFEIFDIDKQYARLDNVEVYGICNGVILYPTRSYLQTPASYDIISAPLVAIGNSSTLYSAKKSRMVVNFRKSVEEIVIKHINNNNIAGVQSLGVGPITFSCPRKISNADGVSIMKDAPSSAPLCGTVPYKFYIENTNCATKTVTLQDLLPVGMLFTPESISFDNQTIASTATINNYGDTNALNVQFDIPSATELVIGVDAYFTASATAGNYSNQATITYTGESGNPVTYNSCDFDLIGCQATTVTGIAVTPTPMPEMTISHTGVTPGAIGNTTYTITVDNTSSGVVSGLVLDVALSEGESITSGLTYSSNISGSVDPSPVTGVNSFFIENITLSSAGVHNISFTVNNTILNNNVGNVFTLSDNPDNACSDNTAITVIYPLPLPYCVKDPNTDTANSFGKVGITAQTKQSNWPENVPNAAIVLESSNKGFVITRLNNAQRDHASFVPVEGMLIYNTTYNCFQLYNGTSWKCIERSCND